MPSSVLDALSLCVCFRWGAIVIYSQVGWTFLCKDCVTCDTFISHWVSLKTWRSFGVCMCVKETVQLLQQMMSNPFAAAHFLATVLCCHHLTPSPLAQGKPHSWWITGVAVGTRQSLGLAARLDTRYWRLGNVKASLKWPVTSVWWGGRGARQSPRSQPEGRVLGCTRAARSPPQDQSPAQPLHRTPPASSLLLQLA